MKTKTESCAERALREWRNENNKTWHKRNPDKVAAKKAVHKAIRKGILTRPDTCSECGALDRIEGHHDSYYEEDWLSVRWLCHDCHEKWHRENGEGERDPKLINGV